MSEIHHTLKKYTRPHIPPDGPPYSPILHLPSRGFLELECLDTMVYAGRSAVEGKGHGIAITDIHGPHSVISAEVEGSKFDHSWAKVLDWTSAFPYWEWIMEVRLYLYGFPLLYLDSRPTFSAHGTIHTIEERRWVRFTMGGPVFQWRYVPLSHYHLI